MTNNSPFDDHIKKQLGNYQPEVPSYVWENIMANKEKRRPGGFLFNIRNGRLALILMILVLSAGSALLIHNNNTGSNKNIAINKAPGPDKTTITDQNNVVNNVTNKTPEKNVEVNNQGNKLNAHIDAATAKNLNSGSTPAHGLAVTASGDKGSNITESNAPVLTGSVHDNSKNSNRKNSGSQQASDRTADSKTKNLVSTKTRNKIKNLASQTQMDIDNPGIESIPVTTQMTTDVKQEANNQDLLLSKYYLTLDPFLAEKTFSFSVKNINVPNLNIPCPGIEKNAAGNKRYFEVYAGPDYVFRSYNDTANSAYLQKRKESTHFSSAFSLGVRYTKVFNNAMSFRTGINFSQVNEKFKFEQGHLVQLVYTIDNNGDTTGSYATTGTRYKTTHNRYRTLDIPLSVGYEMGNGRLHTNINAGLVINLYSWQRGDVLDNAYQPVTITTGKSSSPYQFKTNVGLGFIGGASFYYKLTGNLHILAEPYFRYNFSAANKADITLKQKYTTTGLRLGLRIDF